MPRYGRLGRVHVKMAAASFRFILCRRQFFWLQIQMPDIGFIREFLTELRQNLAGLGAPFVEKGVPLFHIDWAARGRIRGKDAEAIKNRIRGTEKRFSKRSLRPARRPNGRFTHNA